MKYILLLFSLKQILSIVCDIEQDCRLCEKCWEPNNNYCSCSFSNAFCYNYTQISFTYNSTFLFKYDSNKCLESSIQNEICGKSNISEEINDQNFYTFFSFNDPQYLDNNNLFCHYYFKNDKEKEKEDLVIEIDLNIQDIQGNEDNGKNLMLIFVQEYNTPTKSLYEINLNEFMSKKYTIKIAEYKSISIFLNLIRNNNYIGINNYKITYMNLGVKKDLTKVKNMKKYKYTILIICLICIVCVVACFILYLVKYKRNRELYNIRALGMADNMNDLNNRIDPVEKKNRLEKLFKDKLKKKKYLKKLNINETTACSICLEEFIENESLVCITPCSHIFHYDCLHNWLFSENSNCSCPYCNYNLLSKEQPKKRNISKDKINNLEKLDDEIDNPKKNNNFDYSERTIKKANKRNNEKNTNKIEEKNKTSNNKIDNIENNNKNMENKITNNEVKDENEDNDISFENNINNKKEILKNTKGKNKNEINNNIINNKEEDLKNEDEKNINNNINNIKEDENKNNEKNDKNNIDK